MLKTEYIEIEELPVGCVVTDKISGKTIVIGSRQDAEALIESLGRLIDCWYSKESFK